MQCQSETSNVTSNTDYCGFSMNGTSSSSSEYCYYLSERRDDLLQVRDFIPQLDLRGLDLIEK